MRDVNHSIVRPPETADPIADAHEIMRWAHDTYGDGLCLTASFGDATLVHLANVVVPGIEITLLDTGYLFAETEWFADDLRNRYGLNVRVMFPAADLEPNVWQFDTERLLRGPQGRAAQPGARRSVRLGHRPAPGRFTVASHHPDRARRPAQGCREDQPARRLERRRRRRLRGCQRPAGAPARRPRIPVDRLLAVHPPGRRRRRRPRGALGGRRKTECGLHL